MSINIKKLLPIIVLTATILALAFPVSGAFAEEDSLPYENMEATCVEETAPVQQEKEPAEEPAAEKDLRQESAEQVTEQPDSTEETVEEAKQVVSFVAVMPQNRPADDPVDQRKETTDKIVDAIIDTATNFIPYGKTVTNYIKEKSGKPVDQKQAVEDAADEMFGEVLDAIGETAGPIYTVVKDTTKGLWNLYLHLTKSDEQQKRTQID